MNLEVISFDLINFYQLFFVTTVIWKLMILDECSCHCPGLLLSENAIVFIVACIWFRCFMESNF